MNYWLLKSEPSCFSINDLACRPKQTEPWDGVRNYQARNMLRDDMKKGDLGFFYHSSCKEPGIAGIVKIVAEGYPDHTAFDPEADHYDPKSNPDNPRWFMVDVKLVKQFNHVVSLTQLKQNPLLTGMQILKRGNRLSITPLSHAHWEAVLAME